MALHTRKDFFEVETRVRTEEIFKTSRLLSHITGVHVQPNKAIVGENAFAHEAGIHQDGVLKEKLTYEIMRPQDIGRATNKLVMGKHSGRHALAARLQDLGFELDEGALGKAFKRFKDLADRKKEIFDDDLISIVKDDMAQVPETYTLDYLHSISGTGIIPSATVRLKKEEQVFQDSGVGDGPVDAVLNAIDAITGVKGRLQDYQLRAVTSGKDALGEVSVKVDFDGTARLRQGHLDRRDRGERPGLHQRGEPARAPGQGARRPGGRPLGPVMATYKIAVLPGDGIGQEVTPQAQRILQVVGRAAGIGFEFEPALVGGSRHRRHRPAPAAAPAWPSARPRTPSCSARWAGPSGTTCRRSSGPSAGSSPSARSSTSSPTCAPRRASRCWWTPRRSSARWSRAPT